MKLTQAAIDKAKQFNKKHPEKALRISIKGGGCSGLLYELNFVDNPGWVVISGAPNQVRDDVVLCYDGLYVLIDNKAAAILENTELDYTDGLEGSGFKFKNPDATGTCGCGSSFGCP